MSLKVCEQCNVYYGTENNVFYGCSHHPITREDMVKSVEERHLKCQCGKVIFDKKSAQSKKNELERQGQERRLRIYECPESNGWHLTKT